jgi:asparagine synthetase B (glutamine-hydrolysing)
MALALLLLPFAHGCSFLVTSGELTDSQFDFVNYHLKFRGPDLTNRVRHGGLHFVHNLLHMTGEMTPQPLRSPDDSVFVVYNGEIYNAADFGNYQSDGPSILDAYAKHGITFARHLDGEFAIVLVDFAKELVVLATDTFGTKPFFYSLGSGKDSFSAATYSSALERLHRPNIQQMEPNTILVLKMGPERWSLLSTMPLHEFDLRQHKTDTKDWAKAFDRAMLKRVSSSHTVFIGLSSGYDSGALACALVHLRVPHHTYSIMGNEHESTIDERLLQAQHLLLHSQKVNMSKSQFRASKDGLMRDADRYQYEAFHSGTVQDMRDDGAAAALYHISGLARKNTARIYISGTGADEIISDYGWNGKKLTKHSSFGGLFPANLSDVYPWPSFFKGEHVIASCLPSNPTVLQRDPAGISNEGGIRQRLPRA